MQNISEDLLEVVRGLTLCGEALEIVNRFLYLCTSVNTVGAVVRGDKFAHRESQSDEYQYDPSLAPSC